MGFLSALAPAFQVLLKVLDLFEKTPAEKREEQLTALLKYIEDVKNASSKAKDTKGDTSELEKVLNRRR